LLTASCGLESGFDIALRGDSQSTVGVVFDDQEALRLAYQSCQEDPFIDAPPAPGQEPQSQPVTNALAGGKSRAIASVSLATHLRNQEGTGLEDFGADTASIDLFTVEDAERIVDSSRQRAKLAARAAALDPYWQPLATAQSLEEGGNLAGLEDLKERRQVNGRDGGDWEFTRHSSYWDDRDVPLIRQSLNQYCRQAATRMNLDF
jgi:hypothetical protein